MSDLIERDRVIEAIEGTDWYHQNRNKDMVSGANDDEHQAWYKADDIYKVLESIPSARPKEEQIAIGAVCEVICKHCIKANGCCQHHWKCPLLTEIAELIEPKDEPQTEREGE